MIMTGINSSKSPWLLLVLFLCVSWTLTAVHGKGISRSTGGKGGESDSTEQPIVAEEPPPAAGMKWWLPYYVAFLVMFFTYKCCYGMPSAADSKNRQEEYMRRRAEGNAMMEKAAGLEGAIKTKSGLVIIHEKPGTGPAPTGSSTVEVHYTGMLIDGTVFDSSRQRSKPASFPVSRVIAGWTEALQLMKLGGKAKLYIPPGLGYGDNGAGDAIPPGATLIFEVELLKISS